MYQAAPLQGHLQLTPSSYPGNEGHRNAPTHQQSLFGDNSDSDSASNWSDSESEKSTYRDDRAETGPGINPLSRRRRPLHLRNPIPSETYADQGDWDQNQPNPRSGGQAVPYTRPLGTFPSTGGGYTQPQPPPGLHPFQHQPTHSGSLPPGQNNMAHENPFAPIPGPWNSQQARPYHNNTLPPTYGPQPMWPPAPEYAPPYPGPFSTVAPATPYAYPPPKTQPYGGYMPTQHPADPPRESRHASPFRPRRPRPPAGEVPSQEDEVNRLRRRVRDMEMEGHRERDLRQASREREQAERQKWEMDVKVDQLRKDIERSFKSDIRDAVNDIRKEIQTSLSESQSEPGRVPSRMDSGRRGYAGSARSVHGDGDIWAERGGEYQDALMQETTRMKEGRRMLHPQDSTSGAAFRHGMQADRGSARGSRIDPELRSEVETIIYDIIGGSELGQRHYRRPLSRSFNRGTASDSYDPRTEAWDYPRNRYPDTHDGGVNPALGNRFGPRRPPVQVTFDQNDYTIPSAAPSQPADERPWLGAPSRSRRPRRRGEDVAGPSDPRTYGAGLQQQPLPTQANNLRTQPGTHAQDPRHWAGGSNGEAVSSAGANAMAYQDRINNGGVRQGEQSNPTRPLGRRGEHVPASAAAMYEDEDAGELFTDDDESDNEELFSKRDATYPEFPAGHPDLRHQLPRVPDPRPHLRRAGIQ
ncbi:hypothetical protein CDEST_13313 [Colletotrichum destructivum]|uniref:Uncharacterized protein n=1 Tax=Colletotrichum destructivum TaxID=34406 RepID=A0AAX4IYD6_9PEZI|nr:hypothetical protein CDEST_13313 [Colletotrichum destructivum]